MPLGNGVFTPVMRHENFFCSIIVRLWRLVVGCAQLWAMRVPGSRGIYTYTVLWRLVVGCAQLWAMRVQYLGAGEYIVSSL